jgi:hypothetical protein
LKTEQRVNEDKRLKRRKTFRLSRIIGSVYFAKRMLTNNLSKT